MSRSSFPSTTPPPPPRRIPFTRSPIRIDTRNVTAEEKQLFEGATPLGKDIFTDPNKPHITGISPPQELESLDYVDFGPRLNRNIRLANYKILTPVQRLALPVVLSGRDIIVSTQTGSGKTATFLLPILYYASLTGNNGGKTVLPNRSVIVSPVALIIVPTHELCIQTLDEFKRFAYQTGIIVTAVYGGQYVRYQVQSLMKNGADVLVATPGRLHDLSQRGVLDFHVWVFFAWMMLIVLLIPV